MTSGVKSAGNPFLFFLSQVLVLIFKTLHGMGLGYLKDFLSLITSAHPIRSNNRGMLQPRLSRNYAWWVQGGGSYFWEVPHEAWGLRGDGCVADQILCIFIMCLFIMTVFAFILFFFLLCASQENFL